jgi:hypothetical protein
MKEFTNEETIIVISAAKIALNDACLFDVLASQLSLSDSAMLALRDKLQLYEQCEDIEHPPEAFVYYTVDEVAETVSGISSDTYAELWDILIEAEIHGTAKPLGGDGSNGTAEEPIVSSGEYASDLVSAWSKLSKEAKVNIHKAAKNQ